MPTYRSDDLLAVVAPFSRRGASILGDLTLEDLAEDPGLEEVRSLARERLLYALRGRGFHAPRSPALEVHSFVLAKLIAAGAGRRVLSRLADYEAKRFLSLCSRLSMDQLKELAGEMGISIRGELWVDLASYLRGASRIGGRRWRLVNRVVSKGYVLVDRYELERLMAEYVRENVLRTPAAELPDPLRRIAEELSLSERGIEVEARVKGELPPCISELVERVRSGDNLSHQARFALVSYLLSYGWKEEQIIDLLRSLPDFKEKVTAYQVSHIARRRYRPPSCETMRLWGLCADCGRRRD
ncbi:MAG: hypothetical protein BA066_04860 [Candidatus Korarchaeota archaeon NZ13-K]|nr:MAG: hypothetical protein BA066_04860 [Candidatus Korarchaeota archaeon NZ13-K]